MGGRTLARAATLALTLVAGVGAQLPVAGPASAASFAANPGSLGPIPDSASNTCASYGANRDVTFTVAGVASPIENIAVSMTLSPHTGVGELSVTLFAPGGSPSQAVFDRTLATTPTSFGDGSDVAGPYTFSDTAPTSPTWWEAAAATGATAIPAGSYRPSTPGESPSGGANTLFLPVFAGATPNGTWTLRFRDKCSGDTGSVSAATLLLNEPEQPPPDADPPDTTITGQPKAKTKKKKATFEFTGTDARAVASFECSLNGAPFTTCTSPLTVKGKKGKNRFEVRAKDAAGNVDPTPATDDWKVKKKKKK